MALFLSSGSQTQVLTLVWQAFYLLNHLSSIGFCIFNTYPWWFCWVCVESVHQSAFSDRQTCLQNLHWEEQGWLAEVGLCRRAQKTSQESTLNLPICFLGEFCPNCEGRSTVQVTSDPMNLLGLLGSLLLNDDKNPVLDREPVFFSHLV